MQIDQWLRKISHYQQNVPQHYYLLDTLVLSARLRSYIHVPNIAHKTQIKYLDIYIDQNLLWGPQIQHINHILAKNIAIIHKLRYFVDLHTTETGRPRIQREASQLTWAPNVNDFGHVALFVTFLCAVCDSVLEAWVFPTRFSGFSWSVVDTQ